MDKNNIIETARGYLGTKYVHQGRSIAGMDCIGLIICVGRDLGYTIDDAPYAYEQIPNPEVLYTGCDHNFKRITGTQEGCILLMRFHREPQHACIFTGDSIIHSYEKAGRVVEHRFSKVWQARVLRSYIYE